MKRTAMPRRARRDRRTAEDIAAGQNFHRVGTALGCRVCAELGEECEGLVQAHHVLRKQFILSYVDAVAHERYLTKRQKADLARELLWDVRNALGVCYRAHRRHHSRHQPIPFRLVPLSAIAFAAGLGLAYRLENEYPQDGEG